MGRSNGGGKKGSGAFSSSDGAALLSLVMAATDSVPCSAPFLGREPFWSRKTAALMVVTRKGGGAEIAAFIFLAFWMTFLV